MIFQNKTGAGFFEKRYQKNADPWRFETNAYEQGRFQAIAAALEHDHYRKALEPGCSIGTLTERLARFCDHVDASDFSQTAVERACERCAALPNVKIRCAAFGEDSTVRGYDLLVFSEIGYYFKPRKWEDMTVRIAKEMDTGATLLASHWLGESADHRQSGDEVHAALRAQGTLQLEHEERHDRFRLDRFRKI